MTNSDLWYLRYITCCRHWPNTRISLVSMEQSPFWEANRFSASQEIPCVLWNPKLHSRIYKSSPPVPILRQIKQAHAHHSTFRRSVLMFCHPRLGLPSGLFPSDFPPKLCLQLYFPHTCDVPRLISFLIWSSKWWWGALIPKFLLIYLPTSVSDTPLTPYINSYVFRHRDAIYREAL